jgi:streptogramin lyase
MNNPGTAPTSSRKRHVTIAGAATLVIAVLVASVAVAAGGAARGDAVPVAGTVVAKIHVPDAPFALQATPGAVWVGAHRSSFVYRIDTTSNKVVAKIRVAGSNGGSPGAMVAAGGRVIEVNYAFNSIAFINPKTNSAKITAVRFESAGTPVVADGSLWLLGVSSPIAGGNVDRLSRLDPKTGRVLATRTIANTGGFVDAAGSLWGSSNDQIIRLDPTSGKTIGRLAVHGLPLAFADGGVWALENDTVNNQAHILRIDPATGTVVATVVLPGLASSVAATPNGTVWVVEQSGTSHPLLWAIDPTTNTLAGQVDLGNVTSQYDDLTVAADGSVWVSLFDANVVLRIQPS